MSEASIAEAPRIRIGVSSCLLGQEVRYDGGHKHSGYITQTLARHFEFVPFCPEVAIGLGIPRPPIRLVQTPSGVRARGVDQPDRDVTDALVAYGGHVAAEIGGFSGYLFKKGSPSCGMERVKIYTEQGMPATTGAGLYANAIMTAYPLLPVEEEGRLMDPVLRENFIERVFVHHRWQVLQASGLTAQKLVDFHTEHKFSVLAHHEETYRAMGRLVAEAGRRDLDELAAEYFHALMTALKHRATRRRHTNVLMHVMGYLKKHLDSGDKAELLELIERYRNGLVPLIVPITLLKHHLRRFPDPYINRQVYLNPHPDELMLRNGL